MKNIKISIIIPTYNRPQLLTRCLLAIISSVFPEESFETIIVGDGINRKTKKIVTLFQKHFPNIRYLEHPKNLGPAASRNTGWRSAQGDIIAFTDDDTVPDRNWLSEGYKIFNKKRRVDAVFGNVYVPVKTIPTDYEKNTARLSGAGFITANCFTTKKVLAEIGGFDEEFKIAWREDSDLYFSLLEQGKKIVKAPRAMVSHPVQKPVWGISLFEQKKNMYNALLFKKHKYLYRTYIQSDPPVLYYFIVIGVIIIAAGNFTKNSFSIFFGFVVAFICLSMFFYKRTRGISHAPLHLLEMAETSLFIPFAAVFWRLYGACKYKVFFL